MITVIFIFCRDALFEEYDRYKGHRDLYLYLFDLP
jgi:hypothetical protein